MKNEKEKKALGIIALIALRKSDLFREIIFNSVEGKNLSEEKKNKIKKHISEMNDGEFLTKEEKESKKIKKNLKIEELNFNFKKIIENSLK